MGKAYALKVNENTLGYARQYRLDPPLSVTRWEYETDDDVTRTYEYVVVSAVNNQFAHETLVFPSDESGEITGWTEVGGYRGTTDHAEILRYMDYGIITGDGTNERVGTVTTDTGGPEYYSRTDLY